MVARGAGGGGPGERGEGLEKDRVVTTDQSQDVKHGAGNIVSNIMITMDGAGWVLEVSGDHFVNYMTV